MFVCNRPMKCQRTSARIASIEGFDLRAEVLRVVLAEIDEPALECLLHDVHTEPLRDGDERHRLRVTPGTLDAVAELRERRAQRLQSRHAHPDDHRLALTVTARPMRPVPGRARSAVRPRRVRNRDAVLVQHVLDPGYEVERQAPIVPCAPALVDRRPSPPRRGRPRRTRSTPVDARPDDGGDRFAIGRSSASSRSSPAAHHPRARASRRARSPRCRPS